MEMHCELANEKVEQFFQVSTPCVDDHLFEIAELAAVGEFANATHLANHKCPAQHDHSVSVRVQRSPSTMQHILPRTVQFSICDNSKPITSAPMSCSPTAHSAATQEAIGNIADLQLCAGYEPNVQLLDPLASVQSGMERSSTAT